MDHDTTISHDGRTAPLRSRLRRIRLPRVVIAGAALAAAACGGERSGAERAQSDSSRAAAGASGGRMDSMPGMGGMANMPGMGQMMSGRMMAEMDAHMRALRGAGPDSLRRSLPAHRQMVANMISQMNREMGEMNMAADAAWTALIDSVRADLTRMPELSAGELARAMPDHHGRVERLVRAHGDMMRSMSR
ncbi:hypothetical protein [Roseisolibacter agri]|uniref:Uncharacterized protein n=1 Tax=Roseisolibacter agri TaxID=2014610 RepID=A0AA37QFY1_9BACT|nr:hypothetical protein [Roseisolibacter agri]GLC28176.1 hypothetical protein rosag_46890 [Roseisolibacter agri]